LPRLVDGTEGHVRVRRHLAAIAVRHIILAVVEADDIEAVRNFIVQSRLMQWNTVNTYATYSMEEALGLIDEMEPIF
jgi:hypothetical protein